MRIIKWLAGLTINTKDYDWPTSTLLYYALLTVVLAITVTIVSIAVPLGFYGVLQTWMEGCK